MGRYWDKPNGKKPGSGREVSPGKMEIEEREPLNFREDETASWDFRRDPAGHACYDFNKRQPNPDNYRVLGKGSTALAYKAPYSEGAPKASHNTRPNRYNASVKMVAGDFGPAPWD